MGCFLLVAFRASLAIHRQVDTDFTGDLDFMEFLHSVTLCAIESALKDQRILERARQKVQLLDRYRRTVGLELEAFHKQLREAELKTVEYRKKASAQFPGPGKRQLQVVHTATHRAPLRPSTALRIPPKLSTVLRSHPPQPHKAVSHNVFCEVRLVLEPEVTAPAACTKLQTTVS